MRMGKLKWKAGHDPKKFTYGCFLSDLTGFSEISPAPTFRLFYSQGVQQLQGMIFYLARRLLLCRTKSYIIYLYGLDLCDSIVSMYVKN